jgi:DNA-binding response OmpR family regulator
MTHYRIGGRQAGMDPAVNSARLAILVAEDDLLLAADLDEAIRRCGHTCVGPAAGLSEILRLIETERIDAAILDVLLRHGEKVYAAADLLAARGVPFAFVTAYGVAHVDARYAHCRILTKPALPEELELLLEELARASPPRPQSLAAAPR